jgi:Leucine-rich repeat (LRR) protein
MPRSLIDVLRARPRCLGRQRLQAARLDVGTIGPLPAHLTNGVSVVYLSGNSMVSCEGLDQFQDLERLSLAHNPVSALPRFLSPPWPSLRCRSPRPKIPSARSLLAHASSH